MVRKIIGGGDFVGTQNSSHYGISTIQLEIISDTQNWKSSGQNWASMPRLYTTYQTQEYYPGCVIIIAIIFFSGIRTSLSLIFAQFCFQLRKI